MVMALVTVQLSSVDGGAEPTPLQEDAKNRRKRMQRRQSFVMVKGAALLLQDEGEPEEIREPEPLQTAGPSEQQLHLQAMLRLLQEKDTLKLAVRLEPVRSCLTRYLLVVSCVRNTNEEQTILLGVDFPHDGSDGCTIGTVLPIWSNTQVFIDGDGGFSVTIGMDVRSFKPISVQTMWSLLQMLHKACEAAESYNYIPGNAVHSGLAYYQDHHHSPQGCIHVWMATADLTSVCRDAAMPEREENEKIIRKKLRVILRESDLENITSKQVRNALEQHTHCNLKDYSEFIDNEMIIILAQMDQPSKIFPYLYLGSEWNASNLEELQKNRVSHILNVTREIDNFFPETFKYLNIRVLDEESTNLLQYWKETHRFIATAKSQGTSILVHCKMGVSRSASMVIAYAMKEYEWTLEQASKHVKERRSIIQPNAGFLRQLQTYQGILGASKQRRNYLWDPSSSPAISRYPSPPESLANLPSITTRKMNLRCLMRSISEMDVTDSTPELKDKPVERERSASERGSSQLEEFDPELEREDSISNQLDSVSSLDESLLETNESSVDQDESISEVHLVDQDGKLAEPSAENLSECTAMHKESTSVDEVFISPSPRPRSSAARKRSRRKKKLVAQQPVETTRASLPSQSESVAGLQGAGLVSKRLQEVEQEGRKSRMLRQSNVKEMAEES